MFVGVCFIMQKSSFEGAIATIIYTLFACLLADLALVCLLPSSVVHAAGPQLALSQPGTNVNPMQIGGPVGVKVELDGSGFTPNVTLTLYTMTNNDTPQNCRGGGNPDQLGLTPFNKPPVTIQTRGDGTFTQVVTWPGTANTPGVSYYVCAAPQNQQGALSSNTFTVTPMPQLTLSPTTINPGGAITLSGMNWYPPQALTLMLIAANGTTVFTQAITPDQNGNINQPVTLPTTLQDGTYTVRLAANNEQVLVVVQNNVLTVQGNAVVTPTVVPSPSPTITPTVTASPTVRPTTPAGSGSSDSGSSNSGTGSNLWLFALAGLGIVLVIIGIVLFAFYSRRA